MLFNNIPRHNNNTIRYSLTPSRMMIMMNQFLVILAFFLNLSLGFAFSVPSPSTKSKIPTLQDDASILRQQQEIQVDQYYMPPELLPRMENRPAISTQRLSRMDMQRAIADVKRFMENRLELDLNLIRHTAPLAFLSGTGVNDELDGTKSKSAVRFTVPNQDVPRGIQVTDESALPPSPYEMDCEIVQSLAKWKRLMLHRLNCKVGEGIYCDSTSIRKGYKGDVTHSVVADQWDFEIRITREMRNRKQLETFVKTLWKMITDCEDYILTKYPDILLPGHSTADFRLPKEIKFVTAEELHAMFPGQDPHGRENMALKQLGSAIFIVGMGWPMKDGSAAEEVRSPGYDDWNLNGDIMVLHPLTGYRHELSSMGIRVDKDSLVKQLEHRGVLHEKDLDFFQSIIKDEIPFSYGGGIGISRLLMLLLRTGHIGEVQCGVWHDAHYEQAMAAGCDLIPDRIVRLKNNDGGLSP